MESICVWCSYGHLFYMAQPIRWSTTGHRTTGHTKRESSSFSTWIRLRLIAFQMGWWSLCTTKENGRKTNKDDDAKINSQMDGWVDGIIHISFFCFTIRWDFCRPYLFFRLAFYLFFPCPSMVACRCRPNGCRVQKRIYFMNYVVWTCITLSVGGMTRFELVCGTYALTVRWVDTHHSSSIVHEARVFFYSFVSCFQIPKWWKHKVFWLGGNTYVRPKVLIHKSLPGKMNQIDQNISIYKNSATFTILLLLFFKSFRVPSFVLRMFWANPWTSRDLFNRLSEYGSNEFCLPTPDRKNCAVMIIINNNHRTYSSGRAAKKVPAFN